MHKCAAAFALYGTLLISCVGSERSCNRLIWPAGVASASFKEMIQCRFDD